MPPSPGHGAPARIWTDLARGQAHGPLPLLLLLLTTATGVIDAVSILGLGRVFVANMTGNVVFVGFALAGAPGFSLAGSVAALIGFLVGAFAGGALVARFGGHRGHLLRNVTAIELLLVAITLVVTLVDPGAGLVAVAATALLAVAMGMQRAGIVAGLALALVLVAVVAGVAALRSVHPAEWQRGRG